MCIRKAGSERDLSRLTVRPPTIIGNRERSDARGRVCICFGVLGLKFQRKIKKSSFPFVMFARTIKGNLHEAASLYTWCIQVLSRSNRLRKRIFRPAYKSD